jgi:hypothetical protein
MPWTQLTMSGAGNRKGAAADSRDIFELYEVRNAAKRNKDRHPNVHHPHGARRSIRRRDDGLYQIWDDNVLDRGRACHVSYPYIDHVIKHSITGMFFPLVDLC